VSPEAFLKIDPKEMASEKIKEKREQAEEYALWDKRTDWDNEQVKQQGAKYKGMFKCENCNSLKTGFVQY